VSIRDTARAGQADDHFANPASPGAPDISAAIRGRMSAGEESGGFLARALLLGERLDTRALRLAEEAALLLPMTVRVGDGWVVLFR